MKPVRFRKFPKLPISRTLIPFLLVIMLTACSADSSTSPSPTGSSSGSPGNKPVNIPTSLNLNAAHITIDKGGLRIQSRLGFLCPYSEYEGSDQLILASGRTTYNQNEIVQMNAYLNNKFAFGATNFLNGGPPPPSTLRWVLGGSMDLIPGSYDPSLCGVKFQLTNIGNTPIQIPKVGVQLAERPQKNSHSYRLIDECSLIQCGPGPGGGGSCEEYYTSIPLGLGEKNTVFSAVPDAKNPALPYPYPDCGIRTLAPTAQVTLEITLPLDPHIPKSLIYSIAPTFTVDTPQGEQTLMLSQLTSTIAYASASQFSCYQLHETTFSLEKSAIPGSYLGCW